MKYKLIVFDFDGTLADTKRSIIETMKFVGNQFGLNNINESKIERLIGLPIETSLKQVLQISDNKINNAVQLYRENYNNIALATIRLFPNVKASLESLFKNNVILTVASNKGKEALIKILKEQNIYHLFLFVGGVEDCINKKPSPEIVNIILDKFSIQPSECLVIGDTIYDIQMGQKAFSDTCAVTYGNNSEKELIQLSPQFIINNFSEILNILEIEATNDDKK